MMNGSLRVKSKNGYLLVKVNDKNGKLEVQKYPFRNSRNTSKLSKNMQDSGIIKMSTPIKIS